MDEVEEVSKEESILYSLYLMDGEILGKVRLNKVIARLQRDGFPIANRFINQQMGPHDWDIDTNALNLSRNEYIMQTSTVLPGYDRPREDYHLTEKGKVRVEQQIIPKIIKNPYHKRFIYEFDLIKYEYKSLTKSELVEKVHEELCITEDHSRFLIEIDEARRALVNLYDDIVAKNTGYCYTILMLLGSLDFTIRCLNKITENGLLDQATGKNNILAQSKKLLGSIKLFQNKHGDLQRICFMSQRCLLGEECPQDELESIMYTLYCIEWNSEKYGILNPFGENFDLADYMTEEEESQFKSCLPHVSTMV